MPPAGVHPESPVCSCPMGSLLECGGRGLGPRCGQSSDWAGRVGQRLGTARGRGSLCALGPRGPPPPQSPCWGEAADTHRLRPALSAPSSGTPRVEGAFLGVVRHVTNLPQPHHAWGAPSELQESEGREASIPAAWHSLLGSFENTPALTPCPQDLRCVGPR